MTLKSSILVVVCWSFAGQLAFATPPKSEGTAYSCQLYKTDKELEAPQQNREDVRLVQNADAATWQIIAPGESPIIANASDAKFGCMSESKILTWTGGDGKQKRAFICYSDVHVVGEAASFWLGLGQPSLFQPPGYGCATPEDLARENKK